MQATRNCLKSVSDGSHAGLILARYLKEQEGKGTDATKKLKRTELFEHAMEAMERAKPFYERYFARWKDSWRFTPGSEKSYRGSMKEFTIESRMIIGLESDNVLEAGLTLHHTYGVPYIPGSAVKGLCAHYCHELGNDFVEGSKLYRTIFGDQTRAGMVQFHDALIDPTSLKINPTTKENCLHKDVMTPHHRDYYGSPKDKVVSPTEFDSPVPVTFLSVSGKFLFVISCDDKDEDGNVSPNGKRWLDFVWKLLGDALKNKGIGGKTNSGYGFFFDTEEREKKNELETERESREQEARKIEAEKQRMNAGEYQDGDIVEGVRQAPKKSDCFLIDDKFKCYLRKNERSNADHVNVGDHVQLQVDGQRGQGTFYVKVVQ